MSVFQVDGTGALVRSGGSFDRTAGADEIRQSCQVRVRMVRGEVPWDLSRGLRWFDDADNDTPALLSKGTPTAVLSSVVSAKIASVKGVIDVVSLEAIEGPDAGTVEIDYTARYSLDELARTLLARDTIAVGP